MRTIMIEGLEGDEGPGDILGAIVHQVEISGELVGDIQIDGETARVKIDSNIVDLVVEKMDGNQVGKSNVSVQRVD